jgi:hypothetical protein
MLVAVRGRRLLLAVGALVVGCAGLEREPFPEEQIVVADRGPVVVEAADPEGDWVVACLALADTDGDGKIEVMAGHHGDLLGDAVAPYLFWSTGTATGDTASVGMERLEEFLGSDPTGRWLSIVRDGRVALVDARTGQETDLASSTEQFRGNGRGYQPRAPVSFDVVGRRVLYQRGDGASRVAVVRDLESGAEHVLDTQGGLLVAARLFGETWATVDVVLEDTDGSGALESPEIFSTLAPLSCRGPVLSYSTSRQGGDDPVRLVTTAVPHGPTSPLAESVTAFGDILLDATSEHRWPDDGGSGPRRLGLPETCFGVEHVNVARSALLLRCCSDADDELDECHLELFDDAGLHRVYSRSTRLEQASPDGSSLVIRGREGELRTRAVIRVDEGGHLQPLPVHGRVLAVGTGYALVAEWEESSLEMRLSVDLLELDGGSLRSIFSDDSCRASDTVAGRAGDVVAVGPVLIDLGTGRVAGSYEGPALAMDSRRRVLLSRVSGECSAGVPEGPLYWHTPRLP